MAAEGEAMTTYNIYVRTAEGDRLFAQSDDLEEAIMATDWIVGAGADRPGIPGVLAAWVRPGEPGDILRDDAELAERS
jgi:hypothetical protein